MHACAINATKTTAHLNTIAGLRNRTLTRNTPSSVVCTARYAIPKNKQARSYLEKVVFVGVYDFSSVYQHNLRVKHGSPCVMHSDRLMYCLFNLLCHGCLFIPLTIKPILRGRGYLEGAGVNNQQVETLSSPVPRNRTFQRRDAMRMAYGILLSRD